jgi:hypothetical protein
MDPPLEVDSQGVIGDTEGRPKPVNAADLRASESVAAG